MHSGRGDFDIFAVPKQSQKKTFRDGTSANVSRADKKDAFHDARRASVRESKPRIEQVQVNAAIHGREDSPALQRGVCVIKMPKNPGQTIE
jgi:hypothetical protein